MRLVAIAVLASIAAGVGAFQVIDTNQTPEQQFKSQISDMKGSEYQVSYEIDADLSGLGGLISGSVREPELYNDGQNSKMVVDVAGVTMAMYDLFQNRTVTCSEGSILGINNESELDCSVSNTGSIDFEEQFEKVNISRNGTRTVADRKCNMYVLRSQEEINASGVPSAATEYSDGKVNICLDRQKGYPAIMEARSEIEQSELRSGGSSTQSIGLEATSYQDSASAESLEIPVKLATSMTCDPFQANITTFDYSGETKVSINEQNRTINLDENSQRTLDLSTDRRESGSNSLKVYAGENTMEETCYHYGSLGDYGETDYNFSDY